MSRLVRAWPDLGHGATLQARTLEDDGFLRQPFQHGPLSDPDRDIDGAMAAAFGSPIDLLGRLGGGDGRGPRPHLDRHPEGIAVCDAAGRRQMDGLRRFARLGLREQNPAGIALIEVAKSRPAIP